MTVTKTPILANWDLREARAVISNASKVVVLDWDHTLVASVPVSLIERENVDTLTEREGFLGVVQWDLNGRPSKQALFLRPHSDELVRICQMLGYKLVLWSQGVHKYMLDCLKHLEFADQLDLVIPRHPSGALHPKDLWLLQPDLTKVVTVDDSIDNSVFNPFNAIEIRPWRYDNTKDVELTYVPALIRYRFLALERVSPRYLSQLRESILKQTAWGLLQQAIDFISIELKQHWQTASEKSKSSTRKRKDQSQPGVSGSLQARLERKLHDLQDITLLTMMIYDLSTLIQVAEVYNRGLNIYVQQTERAEDPELLAAQIQEAETERNKAVMIMKNIFERLAEEEIHII